MAGRMTEEQVTKAIVKWLVYNGWTIIAFDFPQSGTGKALHPNDTDSKTEGIWIPDIVACRESILVFFENKNQYVYRDFEKIAKLKQTNVYSHAIAEITKGHPFDSIYYGVGFPFSETSINRANSSLDMVDFVVLADNKDHASIHYDRFNVFSTILDTNNNS